MTLRYINEYGTMASEGIDGVTVVYRADAPQPVPGVTWQDIVDRGPAAYVEPAGPSAEDVRAQTFISKRAFLAAVEAAGILTKAERLQAARGEWPAPLAPALTGMSADEALDAQIAWAEATHVARTDPTVLFLASFLSLTDAQVDALFGLDLT